MQYSVAIPIFLMLFGQIMVNLVFINRVTNRLTKVETHLEHLLHRRREDTEKLVSD